LVSSCFSKELALFYLQSRKKSSTTFQVYDSTQLMPIKLCSFVSAKRVQTCPICVAQVRLCVLQVACHNIEMDVEKEERTIRGDVPR
jgi:hypothetical protein